MVMDSCTETVTEDGKLVKHLTFVHSQEKWRKKKVYSIYRKRKSKYEMA